MKLPGLIFNVHLGHTSQPGQRCPGEPIAEQWWECGSPCPTWTPTSGLPHSPLQPSYVSGRRQKPTSKTKWTKQKSPRPGTDELVIMFCNVCCLLSFVLLFLLKKKKNWNTWTFCRLVLAELSWTIWQAPAHQQLAKQGEMLRLITPLHPKQAFFFQTRIEELLRLEKNTKDHLSNQAPMLPTNQVPNYHIYTSLEHWMLKRKQAKLKKITLQHPCLSGCLMLKHRSLYVQ